MRIVLIGDFAQEPDEGMRKVCGFLRESIARQHKLLAVSTRSFCTLRTLRAIRVFRPHCLHYLTGPTVRSLIALRAHRLILGSNCVTVATGLRPYLGRGGRRFLSLIKPDYFLAQARRWERCFAAAGSRTLDFPNAVDCSRFRPVADNERQALRARWNLGGAKPWVLHVGHIKANRSLETLLPLQKSGRYHVLVLGSKSFSEDGQVRKELEAAGCRVITEYIPRVQELYQAADYYVFTVGAIPADRFPSHYRQVGVIDFPLSILEAMACGLPVLTARHDAVEHFLKATEGVAYFDGTPPDCLRQLEALRSVRPRTRAKAEEFDLPKVLDRLEAFYASLGPVCPRAA